MEFWLTDEQAMFRGSISRYLAERYSFRERLQTQLRDPDFDEAHWKSFAELGWLAAPFPESRGGIGGGNTDMALVMEQFGRSLVASPYLSSVVLAGTALLEGGLARRKEDPLARLCGGEARFAFAYAEDSSASDPARAALTAQPVDGGYELTGTKRFVLDAGSADHLLVLARAAGDPGERDGLSLFLVAARAPGVTIDAYRMQDGGRAGDVQFARTRVGREDVIGEEGAACGLVERVLDVATAMVCMEAVGIMWAAHEMTLAYLKVRNQFGHPIASFQALQHRMVDLYAQCQQAQSMAMGAVSALGRQDAIVRSRMVSAAKLRVGAAARHVGQECVQLHGGIGMTREHPIGHHLKRLTRIRTSFGDESYHQRRYLALADPDGYAAW